VQPKCPWLPPGEYPSPGDECTFDVGHDSLWPPRREQRADHATRAGSGILGDSTKIACCRRAVGCGSGRNACSRSLGRTRLDRRSAGQRFVQFWHRPESAHLRPSRRRARTPAERRYRPFASVPVGSWPTQSGHHYLSVNLANSGRLREERLGLLQVSSGEALRELAVDWREQIARFRLSFLCAPQSGEARGGVQLP
jgi:hypothetical protein